MCEMCEFFRKCLSIKAPELTGLRTAYPQLPSNSQANDVKKHHSQELTEYLTAYPHNFTG